MAAPAIYFGVRRTLDWQDEAQVEANLLPPELGWARPYVDRMAELMQQLGIR